MTHDVNEMMTLRSSRERMGMAAGSDVSRPWRILVVDDDEGNRFLSTLMLTRVGCVVETAGDGETGWEKLVCGGFDLLVTDLEMPRLSGLELVRRLRGAGMTLPVIVVSGT